MIGTIRYVTGDATLPEGNGSAARVLVHVCNDRGGWGRGFVLALSRRYPDAERRYREWYAGRAANDFELGAVQFVPVGGGLTVANRIGQHGYRREGGLPPVRYEAIRTGLRTVAAFVQSLPAGTSVHMPRIGCGLAGGDWAVVEGIVSEALCGVGICVMVYDL